MKYIPGLKKADISIDDNVRTNFLYNTLPHKKASIKPVIDNVIAEGDENLVDYLQSHGLSNEANMLVLSTKSHYYYDSAELKEVTTLINLKKLNQITNLNEFLHSVCYSLSPKTNFIGCFSESKSQKGIRLTSWMFKKFLGFLDSKSEIEIDRKDISKLFESTGFKVLNMTVINGLTYFLTQI